MSEPEEQPETEPQLNRNDSSRPDITPLVTVSLVSAASLGLSVFTAALFAVSIALIATSFGWVEVAVDSSFDDKLRAVSEIKSVSITAGVLGTSFTLFLISLWGSLRPGSGFRDRIRLRAPALSHLILVTIGMLAFTQALSGMIFLFSLDQTGNLAEFNAVFQAWDTQKRLLMLPVLALCPGIAEEFFFRGYAFSTAEKSHGWVIAAGLSAVLFGLIHLDPIHSVAATFMGLYLAFAVKVTGSIWTTVLAHIVNNAAAVMFPTLTPDKILFQVVWVICGLAIAGLVMTTLWKSKKQEKPAHS
ncbi:MAG: CPBP family intramembrane glutamic endopeptidase [Myxococcota bacterium]|nr:CPBP family intramembrane glutamic endopeptidase [Myxococcota bacterium]